MDELLSSVSACLTIDLKRQIACFRNCPRARAPGIHPVGRHAVEAVAVAAAAANASATM